MMNKEYTPVSCSFYDLLEASALHRKKMIITVKGIEHEAIIKDVYSKGSEEFLVMTDLVQLHDETIRLDMIELIYDPESNKSYTPNAC